MKFDLKDFFFSFIQEIEKQNSRKFIEENINKIEIAINRLVDIYKNYPKWIFLDVKDFEYSKNINNEDIDNFIIISVGDIHADYNALKKIIEIKLKHPQITVIFLGDYVDRGDFSFEVFLLIILLNLLFFDTIYILPGNHELYHYFKYQNAEFWNSDVILSCLFKPLRNLIEYLPLLISFKSILFIHGGFFDFNSNDEVFIKKLQNEKGMRLKELIKLNEKNVFEIVWADYADNYNDIFYSQASGRPVKTEVDILKLQETFNIKLIIRGHQPSLKGISLNNRVITLLTSSIYAKTGRMKGRLITIIERKNIDKEDIILSEIQRGKIKDELDKKLFLDSNLISVIDLDRVDKLI